MTFFKNSFIYIVGELVSKISPFLLLPYLTKKMGVEGFGELAYYQFLLSLISLFIGLSLESSIARYFYFYGQNALNIAAFIGYIYIISLGAVSALFSWYFGSNIFFIISITAVSLNLMNVQLSIRQFQKQALKYVLYQTSIAVLIPVITILLFEYFERNFVELRYLAIFLVNFAIWLIASISFFKNSHLKFVKKIRTNLIIFSYLFSYGVPLFFHQISGLLKGQADRFLIYNQFSKADLGLYSAGWQLSLPLFIGISAINKAALPFIYEGIKQNKYSLVFFKRTFFFSLIIIFIIFVMLTLLPESLFLWILGKDFVGIKYYFLCFSITSGLVAPYFVLVNILLYFKKTKLVSFYSTISLVTYIILLWIFSEFSNIHYMPFATILSNILLLPMLYYSVNRINFNNKLGL